MMIYFNIEATLELGLSVFVLYFRSTLVQRIYIFPHYLQTKLPPLLIKIMGLILQFCNKPGEIQYNNLKF